MGALLRATDRAAQTLASTAVPSTWPRKRVSESKPPPTPDDPRGTAPMMALLFDVWKMPMPRPTGRNRTM